MCLIISISISCLALYAQNVSVELSQWYSENPKAESYREVRSQLEDIFAKAKVNQIPPELVLEVLHEGAAKNVSPARLAAGADKKLAELVVFQEMLASFPSSFKAFGPGEEKNALFLKTLYLLAKRGMPMAILRSLYAFACENRTDAEILLSVFRGLGHIHVLELIPGKKLDELGRVLLASKLPVSTYLSLGSVFVKGNLGDIPISEITSIIIEAVRDGKGLIRIDQELNRRGRR